MSTPLCVNCISGDKLPGTPKGQMDKVGPYDTYVAAASGAKDKGIILFTDAFGLALQNNKIIADTIAERSDITVYMPDLFDGKPVPPEKLNGAPGSVSETKAQSLLTRTMGKASIMMALGPWIFRNWPTSKYADVEKFITSLKNDRGVQRLGAVGYCFGGNLVVQFNTRGMLDASVVCHPSLTKLESYDNLKAPILFNCAEEDDQFPPTMREQVKAKLDKDSKAPKHEFKVFEDCIHGFAARPNLANEKVKKGFEEATSGTIEWFKSHL